MTYAEVGGASAVSKVCVFEVEGASHQTDAWLVLWEDGISVHPVVRDAERTLMLELSEITSHRKLFFLYNRSPTEGKVVLTLKYVSDPEVLECLFRKRTFKKHHHNGDRRQVRVGGSTDA